MQKEFQLPELGENIPSADILQVYAKAGAIVHKDDIILEIETDKATIEVPSSFDGIVMNVFVQPGDKIKVGQVIMLIETDTDMKVESATANETKTEVLIETTATQGSAAIEMVLPDLGENISQADVLKILVKIGDTLKKDDPILEIETDKATIEVPSTVAGIVTDILIKEGEKAKVGQAILTVSTAMKPAPIKEPQIEKPTILETKIDVPKNVTPSAEKAVPTTPANIVDTQPPILTHPAPAAPSVRRLARELGVDVNKVSGTGPKGRISLDDVKAYVKNINISLSQGAAPSFSSGIVLPDFSQFGAIERAAMSNVREKTAVHLSQAWATIPHVTQFDKADITELEKMRKEFSPKVEEKGAKLTVTAILIKAIASALKVFPQFNCSVDMEKKEIIYKKYFNIGVAVDTERGLIVPVMKNADTMNVTEISLELQRLSEKARNRKISPADLQGGCFTISNLGGIGGAYFTPIINNPEVAILGVSRGAYEQIYMNGFFLPRLMLPLSLSYDHRIIDGADGIRFLRWVIDVLEHPEELKIIN